MAGLSFAFREANVLVFAPLFLGALLRRDPGAWALVAGGLVGLVFRAVSAALFFGDPFFAKAPDPFTLSSLSETLPLYALSLFVFCPGGGVAALLYRGERRAEIVSTFVLFVVFHLSYSYSAVESGLAKRLVLGPRYFIPLLPLLAFASAETWPRLAARASLPVQRAGERLLGVMLPAIALVLALGLAAMHWVHADWASHQAKLRAAIHERTPDGAVVVTNTEATGKFMDYVEGGRVVLDRRRLGVAGARRLLETRRDFHLVLLDRSDSDFWRRNAFDNADFVSRLPGEKELLLDLRATPTDRLRVWRVTAPRRGAD